MLHIRSSLVRNADYGCRHLVLFILQMSWFEDWNENMSGFSDGSDECSREPRTLISWSCPFPFSFSLSLFSVLLFKSLVVWLTWVKLVYAIFFYKHVDSIGKKA